MPIDSDRPGVARLRRAIGDLVALPSVPAAWVARELPAVAAGSADVMTKSFDLGFVFVSLHDSNGRVAAHFARGNPRLAVGHSPQDCLPEGGRLSRAEIFPSIGDDAQGGRGIVIPVGVDAGHALYRERVIARLSRPFFASGTRRRSMPEGQQSRGRTYEQRARASFGSGDDSGACVEGWARRQL
jgi:hypothetical protein